MKILIISDIHGNLEAIQSLSEDFNELWVLGDLVACRGVTISML
jgi:predicted phosphodiesterase